MMRQKAISLVLETAKQETDIQIGKFQDWIEPSIWTKCMLAALVNGVKGDKWYSLIDKVYKPRTLEAAWQQVAKNHGAAGLDGVSIKKFKANKEVYLAEIEEDLKSDSYRPMAVRRVHIPKGNGKTRPLGIPVVKDRVVQAAMKMVMEPIFEKEFLDMSYGFRPKRG